MLGRQPSQSSTRSSTRYVAVVARVRHRDMIERVLFLQRDTFLIFVEEVIAANKFCDKHLDKQPGDGLPLAVAVAVVGASVRWRAARGYKPVWLRPAFAAAASP